MNNQLVARHLARAIDYALSSHYLIRAFGSCGIDGDRLGVAEQDDQVDFATFAKQLEVDWGGCFGILLKNLW